jgi:aminopeptidase N
MKKLFAFCLILTVKFAGAQVQHVCSQSKLSSSLRTTLTKNNLNSAEASLIEKYDVGFHHLSLAVERTGTAIKGSVRTIARSRVAQLDTFLFQLHSNFIVDSILTPSQDRLPFAKMGNVTAVLLPQSVGLNQIIDLTIYYRGTPPSGASAAIGNGFSNRASPTYGNQITWSLSEPYSAYEWWPCKQSLQDKIDSCFISITTDTSNKVGSNGNLVSVEPKDNGKHTYHWQTRYAMNYYLVALTVGQYREYVSYAKPKQIADSILIQNYIYNATAYNNNKASIDITAKQLELFSDLFGVYPYHKEKYGHMMAPFSGGMEHQTMSSMGIFNFGIVAHELGHQWFGNHVTCATWSDIWLNEGFASYTEYLAAKYLNSPANALNVLNGMHTSAKAGIGSVYVTDTSDVNRIFSSALTYEKGGSAVRVLHYILGDSLFFNMCRTYFDRFGNGNASTADLAQVCKEVSGKNLDYYFDQWIYGAGFPSYQIKWNYKDGKLFVKLTQSNAQDANNVFNLSLPLLIRRAGASDTLVYLNNTKSNELFEIGLTDSVNFIQLDPENWILKNVQVTFDGGLNGEKEQKMNDNLFVVYPNPANASLQFLYGNDHNLALTIYNLQGEKCLETILTQNREVNVLHLPNGIYFYYLTTSEHAQSGKFVINRN